VIIKLREMSDCDDDMKIPEWMGDFGTEQSSYWIQRIPTSGEPQRVVG
jgi:hypothetical protein